MKGYYDIEKIGEDKAFSNKLKSIEYVQINFNDNIKSMASSIRNDLDEILEKRKIKPELEDFINDEVISNLKEIELNIDTVIVNCQRVTGLKIKNLKGLGYKMKRSFLKKGQLLFLLDSNTSKVYGKTLLHLQEELRKEILELKKDIDKLGLLEEKEILDHINYINREYFRITSDMYTIIDDINEGIDSIYGNISANRDKNINLSFLLISAFLSVILFFPEFNSMLNLKNEELTLEEKIDDIVYEKVIDDTHIDELIDIKLSIEDHDIEEELRLDYDIDTKEEMVKKIVLNKIKMENKNLEKEKNRINIFVTILFIILIPFLIWIVFISI